MSKNLQKVVRAGTRTSLLFLSISPVSVIAAAATVGTFIDSITNFIKGFIPVLLALAVLVFFWGLVKFINHADDEKAVEEGKQLMLWGMIALFVMIALWGILGWIQVELGINVAGSLGTLPNPPTTIPNP